MKLYFPIVLFEADKYCNHSKLYVEKYMENVKHIEVQILADKYGNVISLGERNCSIQKNNKKVIEECPAANINNMERKEVNDTAIKIAKLLNYDNIGTVEFLIDDKGNTYFMEINARLQVEYGITEEVTGINIIQEQINFAFGEKCIYTQENVIQNGYAIECRINACNKDKYFLPISSKVNKIIKDEKLNVRVDTAIYENYEIPIWYDELLSKIIVHENTRKDCVNTMHKFLKSYDISGVICNKESLIEIMEDQNFKTGNYYLNSIRFS